MPGIRSDVDPDGLLPNIQSFSRTDPSIICRDFQGVMQDISETLMSTIRHQSPLSRAAVPTVWRRLRGSLQTIGIVSFSAMVGLVFVGAKFSMQGDIPTSCTVLKPSRRMSSATPSFAPAPVEEVVAAIRVGEAVACLCTACRDVFRHNSF